MHQSSNHSKFQRMRRRLDLFRQKKEEQSVSHPLRACLPFLCATGVLMTTVVTAASCTLCYRVDAQGQSLAFFHDVATYDAAVSQAETRASKILETQYSLNQDLSVRATLAPKDQIESLSGVTGSLMESIPELEHVYTLSVDGTMVGAAQDPSVITQALNLVKERYTTPETRSLHIDSQVDIRYQYLPADTGESTAEEMAAALLAQSPRTFSYTTQPGDTMESITALFSMTEERFRELNPDLTLEPAAPTASSPLDELPDNEAADAQVSAAEEPSPDSAEADSQADENDIDLEALLGDQLQTPLEAGLTITIEQSCPLLVVSTVEEMNLTREILPDLETQEDDTMFQGQQRIIQEGEAGQSSVLSRVVKRCGVPVASNDLSAVTLSEATPLIVGTGTKAMPELPDGCLFLWPVQGPITSEFGYRFIFGENNFHRGLDIAAAPGTAINAAADGTVIFSGEKGTYGNLVILSHGNGFLTYYAHCSKLLVQVGDSVTQGQPIAAVGSTGRSTGPHCHFEVRYQNNPIDPLFYLPGENNAPVRTEPPEEEVPPAEEPPVSPETPEQPTEPVEPNVPAEPSQPDDPDSSTEDPAAPPEELEAGGGAAGQASPSPSP